MRQIALFIFLLLSFASLCQEEEKQINPHKAFENKNYAEAIKGLETELVGDPSDYDLQLKLGLCYLYSYIDRPKSIELLDKLVMKVFPEALDLNHESLYVNILNVANFISKLSDSRALFTYNKLTGRVL